AEIDPAAYLISNIGENGEIAPMYTGIHPENALTIADVQNFYHIGNIGYVRNLETHVFQISGEGATGIIEWIAMDDASVNVFVPYYPMLTTDVDASYKLSTATAEFVEEEPAEGLYYATSVNRRVNGERVSVDGFMILPENWADSMYWSFDALSNLIKSGAATEEQAAAVYDALSAKQAEVNEAFAALTAQLAEAADPAQLATDWSMKNAQAVHELAVTLTNGLIAE
ncbi:MAG: C69 family dipeptidase, partial [Clostridia bacterium]|nr:C69 family dipeptidase [Clostridia bacterium]